MRNLKEPVKGPGRAGLASEAAEGGEGGGEERLTLLEGGVGQGPSSGKQQRRERSSLASGAGGTPGDAAEGAPRPW